MSRNENRERLKLRPLSYAATASLIMTIALILAGCTGPSGEKKRSGQEDENITYHADFDIVMTARSIADAINVGERLDSTEYDYEGVLTDGQGRPLYTDIHGTPGEWIVDVVTDRSAAIRNVSLGDLLPDDLQAYILSGMGITGDAEIPTEEYSDDAETEVSVYDFGSGVIRFEKRRAVAPNGIDATFMNIVLRAKA